MDNILDITLYTKCLNTALAKQQILEDDVKTQSKRVHDLERSVADITVALEAMNTTGVLVQKEFKGVIEELVTQALQYVYGDTHSFKLESKIIRNQPEVYMYLIIDGEEFSPRDDEVSGGQADVVSFALRVILWAMQQERTRATLIFDEPFKFLGNGVEASAVGQMLLYLSKMLKLQFLIVTHNTNIVVKGMNRYNVQMNSKGISSLSPIEVTEDVL